MSSLSLQQIFYILTSLSQSVFIITDRVSVNHEHLHFTGDNFCTIYHAFFSSRFYEVGQVLIVDARSIQALPGNLE